MGLDSKLNEFGISNEIIEYNLKKTKHKKAILVGARLNSIDPSGLICLDLTLSGSFRKNITLHISKEKIARTERNLQIDKILNG